MKCPRCGAPLIESEGVKYGGKSSYYCNVCVATKVGYINKIKITMANLDLNRKVTHRVIDHIDSVGMEGVYEGSLDDCQEFVSEQGMDFGLEIIQI